MFHCEVCLEEVEFSDDEAYEVCTHDRSLRKLDPFEILWESHTTGLRAIGEGHHVSRDSEADDKGGLPRWFVPAWEAASCIDRLV